MPQPRSPPPRRRPVEPYFKVFSFFVPLAQGVGGLLILAEAQRLAKLGDGPSR